MSAAVMMLSRFVVSEGAEILFEVFLEILLRIFSISRDENTGAAALSAVFSSFK